jgi:hypothetical protein
MPIYRLRIVPTVSGRQRPYSSFVSSRRRVWRKRCISARYKLDIDHKVIQAGRFDDKSTPEEQENFLVSSLDLLFESRAPLTRQ